MKVRSAEGRYNVVVTGRLGGRDLRRLERACGPALEHQHPPLTVRLATIESIDAPARAFLDRLVGLGAVLLFD
jgi:hypothetical protein